MKNHLLFLFIFCLEITHAQVTEIKYLSGKGSDDAIEWDFFCTKGAKSGSWNKIKVPSCWETEGYGTYNYGHDKNKANEEGLYKTKFQIPADWKSKRIFIVFEGSMTDTEIKVNGKQAGTVHQGAFYRFKREITNLVHYGKSNDLDVKVSKMSANNSINEAEREADFWVFGGIFRPVYLEAVPNEFIDYTAIDARHTGDVKADIILSGNLSDIDAQMVVLDQQNKVIGKLSSTPAAGKKNKISLSGHIADVKPWSSESPTLYSASISISRKGKMLHTITEKIGFRTVEVREHDGVYVNGVKMMFKGVNRHSFWPTTGRTTNKQLSIDDVNLIKAMNMNAVRMSHYPPDKHFLEVCDSLGLYVIDELCAWQYPPYDTPVGKVLVREMLTRDINHPSIVFWANGNEGGFNFDLDPLFPQYDIQKRAVLHPWAKFSCINTAHYINYDTGINNLFHGRDIFMPTEILHGLYDGGHGAGLDDYWNLMRSNNLSAGMFLWDLADQAVVRTDRNGFLDTDKDHGADGITGPYREKEGSFFTIKEIWSPVHLEKKYITPTWDKRLIIENRYAFTNTNECTFKFRLAKVTNLSVDGVTSVTGRIASPDCKPGEKSAITLDLPKDWKDYDILYVTATDRENRELCTWSYEIGNPLKVASRCLPTDKSAPAAQAQDLGADWLLSAAGVEARINKETGLLHAVVYQGETIPLSNGPVLITDKQVTCKSVQYKLAEGNPHLTVTYVTNNGKDVAYGFTWTMLPSGVLQLDYDYRPQDKISMAGITFDFPEEGVKGATLFANGPYRVYKNRMKGGTLNVWNKTYNNTVTGESWDYPEFKGYYSLFYGMKLDCPTPFAVYSGKEDVILHLFTPAIQSLYAADRNYTVPAYPKGNISFMSAIPPVGTKFGKAENYGPQSQLHRFSGNGAENNISGQLFFDFNTINK